MDPRMITVKYDTKCAETGKPLKKGEQTLYYPKGKALYHPDSEQAADYRRWQADLAMGGNY